MIKKFKHRVVTILDPQSNFEQLLNKYLFTKNAFLKKIYRYRMFKNFNIIIGKNTRIGKNVRFPHPFNIVIGDGAVIGDNSIIYHGVTIGVKSREDILLNRVNDEQKIIYPHIENNVIIYANSSIVGNIIIGQNTVIGSNVIIHSNIPKNSIVTLNQEIKIRNKRLKNRDKELKNDTST
ncbi:hypothetical protein DOK78_002987 [Enterococcus sp. DIV2402]|uniref:Serine acetyltransferase n=1 Tax=Candidatus Enterococcus lowellii TaxID=2230877 RepID=A0ABZ2SRD7_9ENTE|nr:DapH/DapD/GlmU-related protein [Enterococcus sp. DIV2402]MBO0465350.1 hypothetical protein [Enterococcus sp. DIV2402]